MHFVYRYEGIIIRFLADIVIIQLWTLKACTLTIMICDSTFVLHIALLFIPTLNSVMPTEILPREVSTLPIRVSPNE